jgi:nitrite reductase (NADH) large subunit
MIVCHCAGVSDSTIARHIEQGVTSVAEITRLTGAGRRCGPCREEIATLLSERLPMYGGPSTEGRADLVAAL